MPNQPDLLTTAEAARAIGVASETVRLWENHGKLPAIRTATGVRIFSRTDVERVALEYQATTESRMARR